MRTFYVGRSIARTALKVPVWLAFGAMIVWLVMTLWNWLLPFLFIGARPIDYGQTLGLIVLCRVLFGAGGRCAARRRFHNMNDEERVQFKQCRRDGRRGLNPAQPEAAK